MKNQINHNMIEIQEALVSYGLKEKEAKVYLACLYNGASSTLRIARETKLPRTTIYGILSVLEQKNLINKIVQGKISRFVAVDPKLIVEQSLKQYTSIKKVSQDLKAMFHLVKNEPKFSYYQGEGEIRKEYWNILNIPRLKEYDIVSDTTYFLTFLGDNEAKRFMKERANKKIKTRVIVRDNPKIRTFKGDEKKLLTTIKIVPDKLFPDLSSFVLILPTQVIFVGVRDKIMIKIESKEIRQPLKTMFEIIWNSKLELS